MLLHMLACAILPCSAILGSDGTTFITMLHAAGLFRITKHRCDVAFDKSEDLPPVERQEVETRNILGIVKLHQQGAEFIKFIYATCWKMYFSTQGPIVVAASLCMARAYDYIKLQPSLENRELLVHLTLVPLILFYSYIINNICQMCLDTSGDVFWSLSDAPWYKGTIASQKMTLFLLQHCKPIGFTFAGGYQANLEGFSVVTVSFTYVKIEFYGE
ncbi:uncharacterized protein LOC143212638 isoform X2 [Lasioglossum baleicum]|uniref:uncharacterized protein LOC143212638 isoform X2 n=1 Tax=Lasioglossum baleicum TaxID=434251 RepID=UPI003FCCC2D6